MRTEQLGNIVSISKGRKHEIIALPNEYSRRLIQIDDLRNNDAIKYTNDRHGIEITINDVIIAWDGANAGTVGFNLEGVVGSTLARLRPHSIKEVFPRYLGYFLKSKYSIIRSRTTGATIPHLNREILESIEIPIPSLIRQKQIVQVLDKAQELIDWRKTSIELLESILQNVFKDTFGDVTKNNLNWGKQNLKSVSKKFNDGPFGSNLKSEHYQKDGIRVIRLQNIGVRQFDDSDKVYISKEHLKTLSKYACYPGDILIGTMGEPNLRACALPENIEIAINKADCLLFRPDKTKVTIEYLLYLFNDKSFISSVSNLILGQTRGRISYGRLSQVDIPVPPLPVQENFSSIIQCGIKQLEFMNYQLEGLNNLQRGLSHLAFAGNIDFNFDPQTDKEEVDVTDLIDWSVNPKLVENLEKELEDDVDPNTEEGKIILKKRLQLSLKALEKEFTNRVFTASQAFSFIQQDQGGAAIDYEAYRQLIWRLLDEGRLHQTWHPADSPAAQMLLEFTDGDQI